ncbi:MAG: T9SS type A sorting domain-containing protein [Ignavibacteriales bacterium]|nr:T9SS type A sorting domain-containing protein [Ignavibacteriales bacterium]
MKKLLYMLLLFITFNFIYSQVAYEVTVEPVADGTNLTLSMYIQSTGATPFKLGWASFRLNCNKDALNLGSAPVEVAEGIFDNGNDPVNYADQFTSRSSAVGWVGVEIDANVTFDGITVPTTKTLLGTISIPITNANAMALLTGWHASKVVLDVDLNDLTANGTWTVPTDIPLPVELKSFTAQPQGRVINFEFKTAQEINSSYALVEVKEQGTNEWKQVTKIQMKGNTSTEQTYTYTDRSLGTGKYDGRLKLVDLDGTFKYSSVVSFEAGVPSQFALAQNYPNPFNPTTTIEYDLPKDTRVKIEIYSLTGELVKTLINQELKAGYQTTYWNGTDNNGKTVTSGVYLYRIATPDFSMTKKMMFLK